ncbi:hypothetical protein LPJ53_000049 [Coemansia erecta]|uniref:Uncharacterized protein n=1 Tax=Coemansia erecta TaxID=147472 RepID=A0A9W8CW25_9FUNG|nr:hypothetical protein LPJ53_000049 [Coemansia erecta]
MLASKSGVYEAPFRISLLSCCEIRSPAIPQFLSTKKDAPSEHRGTQDSKVESARHAQNGQDHVDESYEQALQRIWGPNESVNTSRYPSKRRVYSWSAEGDESDLFSVWLCPEVENRIRRKQIQRKRALELAQAIIAPAASTAEEHGDSDNGDDDRPRKISRKRRLSSTPEPDTSISDAAEMCSPELSKPQLLLIPELLPKGMFREAKAGCMSSTTTSGPALTISDSMDSHQADTQDDQFGLGLDLGFDIARGTSKREDSSESAAIGSSILEITNFLERDIDVYAPLEVGRGTATTNTTLFPKPLLPPPPLPIDFASLMVSTDASKTKAGVNGDDGTLPRCTSRPQDLVNDILGMEL